MRNLTSDRALRKTFALVAEAGPAQTDFDALFAPLAADPHAARDAVRDIDNMPLIAEPQRVRDDLDAVRSRRRVSATG